MAELGSRIDRLARSGLLSALLAISFPFAAFSQPGERVDGLIEGNGREETAATCTGCHYSGQFSGQRLTRQDWQMVMSTMIDEYDMTVPDDDIRKAVLDYLSAYFGPEPEG